MRIGFASVYSWRPHVEHLYFLATLATKAGHEAYFLTCDGDLPDCYIRELRDKPAWQECLQCRVGGVRSFTGRNVSSIRTHSRQSASSATVPEEWTFSSASTLGRFESDADYDSDEFRRLVSRLHPAVQLSYQAARTWIQHNELDAVCVFNGRMDATRAIYEAAKSLGVRVVSLERTWFGDGLQLLPDENCLGLHSVDELVAEWGTRPLTREQALLAASQIAGRFQRSNVKEWRAYNTNAKSVAWPVEAHGRRILLIPSSRNEFWGHSDWKSEWPQPTDAYEALITRLALSPQDMILRCHPNWGEKIGKQSGAFSERYYMDWAARKGVLCIPSVDTTSTMSLIEQCDAIVVASGSAALEAGILGKQVISTAPSIYQKAGFQDSMCNPQQLPSLLLHADLEQGQRDLLAMHISRQTLRFCYTMVYRLPQYTGFVKAETTTKYRYNFDADPRRFVELLRTGRLTADDDVFAHSVAEENEMLDLIAGRDWGSVCRQSAKEEHEFVPIRRRLLFRPVDLVSNWKPVGDR